VTQIIMNRPQYLNAISHPMYKELEDAFDRAAADPQCRVIVHSGAGKCFSASHDVMSPEATLSENGIPFDKLAEQLGSKKAAQAYRMERHNYYSFEIKLKKWRDIPKPTIAMVHGWCIYGAVFSAAAMDLIFASEDAMFIFPFGQYDTTIWDFGPRKTKEILFEHRAIPAREAYEFGFITRIYPDYATLEKETLAYAQRVAENEQLTQIRLAKQCINRTLDIQGFAASVDMANVAYRLMNATATDTEREDIAKAKGQARVPRAMANLEAKRKSQP
jgi:enoyl-CoA hydratase